METKTNGAKIAFLIYAWDRFDYLYITLSSIFRIAGIDRCPVFVSVDGGSGQEESIKSVLSEFPLSGWLIRDEKIGWLRHPTASIQALMDYGYEEVGAVLLA